MLTIKQETYVGMPYVVNWRPAILLYLVVTYLAVFIYLMNYGAYDEKAYLSTLDLIRSYGYRAQEHNIETKDGFVITLHRIMSREPYKRNSPVIVIITPFSVSTRAFVYYSPKEYAYQFADEGYDVWLANLRGNNEVRPIREIQLAQEQPTDFSYYEQGVYDIPAIIDNILKKTGKDNLQVVAPGTAFISLMITLASKPKYNLKISKVLNLGYPTEYSAYLDMIMKQSPNFKWLYENTESLPIDPVKLTDLICGNPLFPFPCDNSYNKKDIDLKMMTSPSSTNTEPASDIFGNILTWIESFGQNDYEGNIKRNNLPTPPKYNLSNVKVPVKVYNADNDNLSSQDQKKIYEEIPNIRDSYLIEGDFTNDNFVINSHKFPNFIDDMIDTLNNEVL